MVIQILSIPWTYLNKFDHYFNDIFNHLRCDIIRSAKIYLLNTKFIYYKSHKWV